MKIVICSLATLMFSGVAGIASADQLDVHGTAMDNRLSQREDAGFERRHFDWVRNDSAPAPVAAAPEISSASAISALVLLGGALILLHGRYSIKPKT